MRGHRKSSEPSCKRKAEKMGELVRLLLMAVAVVATAMAGVAGQPACVAELIPCQNSLNSTRPAPACCSSLKQAVEKDLACLCDLFKDKNLFKAFNINLTQALELPKHCGISQGVDACTSGAPGSAPGPAPTSGGSSSSLPPGTNRPVNKGESVGSTRFTTLVAMLLLSWASAMVYA